MVKQMLTVKLCRGLVLVICWYETMKLDKTYHLCNILQLDHPCVGYKVSSVLRTPQGHSFDIDLYVSHCHHSSDGSRSLCL